MITLAKVRRDLLRHKLDDQILVYDRERDAVHLLDPTTACVLDLLEEGGRDVDGVTAELARRIGYQPSPGLLLLALDELRRAKLLDEMEGERAPLKGASMFRRGMIKKVVAAGASAFLVPAIVSLSPTTAYAQTSCIAKDACCDTAGDLCCDAKQTCKAEAKCASGFKCKP